MPVPVYGTFSQEALDREYSPSSLSPGFRDVLRRQARYSARIRSVLPCETDVAYGPDPCERLDFFPAPGAAGGSRGRVPVHVFVHGGHWQESSKEESAYAALAVTRAGASFIAVGYGLAPVFSMEQMVAQVARALCWVREHARELGSRPDAVYASGSSAGAHLIAAALSSAPAVSGVQRPEVAGVCLMSGVYDLRPVRLSYVNRAVGLDDAAVLAHSPVEHLPLRTPLVILARGDRETGEYARQHQEFADALNRCGRGRVRDLVVAGRDHFALPGDLCVPGTALGAAVLGQMGLG
ncbi:alpha/beta hydrolase [Streptomyces olivaceus]|uniref:Alpha/beta hydrolase n=1 Tax=Streptomyces olivaceus TaxID=47716 RepID=A0A2R3ZQ21_STROV|nr:alpha/beta hydrolase [Streptomyces olivaceus]AVR52616.1 alpha/beta hydrolase [Streptomyces olivaceus]MBZ6089964.1 alpha/beta hydrolase [Streptomyces olivaceus]MBZ6098475.1 alpha/beta hydrolase [Streptomyces olivaceus]MBZ6119278.1 alpha/beta hydrolase [Streptomyces olivaceus]MBZ6151989.1 alpha/beta hydrolase [Streptomyces olivaceus]